MNQRKRIAVITCSPEEIYQSNLLKGIFSRCAQYNYDVAVITPLIQMTHFYGIYANGEINIYNLLNPENFDGIILTSLPLKKDGDFSILEKIVEQLHSSGCKNVVSIDKEVKWYPSVFIDDKSPFMEISDHIFKFHGCSDVYFLSGPKGGDSSERLEGYIEYLNKNGIPYDESKIFCGDFWYTSGQNLADDIYYGKVHKPEAVICASDHMAIGLVNRLTKHGIKVPEEIIVTGFDSTVEGALGDISITSYNPKIFENAENAVDMIHKMIEPDIPVLSESGNSDHSLVFGDSCDCVNTDSYFRKTFRQNLFTMNHNFTDENEDEQYDVGTLSESYILEKLVRAKNQKENLRDIIAAAYILKPMENFTICLRPDWLNSTDPLVTGYPERMHLTGRKCIKDESYSKYDIYNMEEECFDTSLMLPEMHEEHETPRVYYFMPLHFDDFNFGYCVLIKQLGTAAILNSVPRQWIRYVNTSLEMTKIRTKIFNDTIIDVTTGLYNRHGMYTTVADYFKRASSDNEYLASVGRPLKNISVMVIMIDMDGLKRINDNFGHKEGDFGINMIADALKSVMLNEDLAVRNGGDEFLFITVGDYSNEELDQKAEEKIRNIEKFISEKSAVSGKPYPISASFGYASSVFSEISTLDSLISVADEKMYENKKKKKAERKD